MQALAVEEAAARAAHEAAATAARAHKATALLEALDTSLPFKIKQGQAEVRYSIFKNRLSPRCVTTNPPKLAREKLK